MSMNEVRGKSFSWVFVFVFCFYLLRLSQSKLLWSSKKDANTWKREKQRSAQNPGTHYPISSSNQTSTTLTSEKKACSWIQTRSLLQLKPLTFFRGLVGMTHLIHTFFFLVPTLVLWSHQKYCISQRTPVHAWQWVAQKRTHHAAKKKEHKTKVLGSFLNMKRMY